MIELINVSKVYKAKNGTAVTALNNLNLKFGNTGMVFILGKSGSGKSTLLNILGGLDGATKGEIIVNGKTISNFKTEEYDAYRNTYIGFVFQEFNILEEYNIYENVALALELQNIKSEKSKIDNLLAKLGISGLGNRKVNELSGGQKQRVAIARALVKNPAIILADEPTGNLDKKSSAQIFEILKEISKEKLVIVVSHDIESAHTYADRIVEIEDGIVKSDEGYLAASPVADFKLKKSKLPNLYALKMAIANSKFKPLKLILTIILTAFSLIFMGIAINFCLFDEPLLVVNTMKDNDDYIYDVYNSEFYYTEYDEIGFNDLILKDDDLINIKDITNSKINPVYTLYDKTGTLGFEFGPNEINSSFYATVGLKFKFVDVKDQRLFDNIIGSAPINNNEIVVHKFFADYVIKFGIKLVDDTLYFPKDYNDLVSSRKEIKLGSNKVIITGIIDDDDTLFQDAKESGKFVNNELLTYFRYNYQGKGVYIYTNGLIDNVVLNVDKLDTVLAQIRLSKSGNGVSTTNLTPLNSSIKIFDGNVENDISYLNKDEIVISFNTLKQINKSFDNELLSYIEKHHNLSYDEALNSYLIEYLKDNLPKLSLTLHDFANEEYIEVHVKGLSLDNTDYISYDYVDKYVPKTKEIESVRIYDDDTDNLKKSVNKLKFKENYDHVGTFYSYTINYSSGITMVSGAYKFLAKYLLIISLVFILFNILLFSNFITITITYSKKQIGILRALGATSKDVTKIFGFESLIIDVISWVLAIIGFIITCNLLNYSLFGKMYYTLNGVVKNPLIPIIMFAYTIAISFLITSVAINKVTKIKPIDAILNK